jgi:YaiO family outer membrane protein
MVCKLFASLIVIFLLPQTLHSQEESPGPNSDFKTAAEKIFSGKRSDGRSILYRILKDNPEDYDARILLARSYAWDNDYKSARLELETVLLKHPNMKDALIAMVDLEMWDNQYERALFTVNIALTHYYDSPEFLFKKARILNNLDRSDEALVVLDVLLNSQPHHEEGISLLKSIRSRRMKYTVGFCHGVTFFSRTFSTASYSAVQVGKANTWGSSILRFNYASRFAKSGLQSELDLYPKLMSGVYAYFNYGYSKSNLFSRHRVGAELYSKLPRRLEASAGFRYFCFRSEHNVLIYTGSLGWYFKNYWFSYRPYITTNEGHTSFSSALILRRYFSDSDNYIGLDIGLGFSPEEQRMKNTSLNGKDLYIVKSKNFGITYQKKFQNEFIMNLSCSILHQELSFDLGNYVWVTSSQIAIKKKF